MHPEEQQASSHRANNCPANHIAGCHFADFHSGSGPSGTRQDNPSYQLWRVLQERRAHVHRLLRGNKLPHACTSTRHTRPCQHASTRGRSTSHPYATERGNNERGCLEKGELLAGHWLEGRRDKGTKNANGWGHATWGQRPALCLVPSLARMSTRSDGVRGTSFISGWAMTPTLCAIKSPRERDMARPCANHT
jgi:hypothetical protein